MSLESFADDLSDAETTSRVGVPPAAEIAQLVGEGKFCAAARLYSEMTGADLIESKLAIDRLARRHGLAPAGGCASYLGLMVLVGGAVAWGAARVVVLLS